MNSARDTRVVAVDPLRDRVNPLPMGLCNPQSLDCADALRAVRQARRWSYCALQIALAGVVEEPLERRMLQGTHVLAPQPVVGHPLLLVVVLGPGDVAHMATGLLPSSRALALMAAVPVTSWVSARSATVGACLTGFLAKLGVSA